MSTIHQDAAAGNWLGLTLMEQLGNIGSEVERALRWRSKNNQEYTHKAMQRALELIDLTIADPRMTTRLRELTRLREELCDYFFGENTWNTKPEKLSKNFLYYGIPARKDK